MFKNYNQAEPVKRIISVLYLFLLCTFMQAQETYTIKIKKNKAGVVNAKGKEVIPFRYEEITPSGTEGFFIVKLAGRYGILDYLDQPRTAVIFDSITPAAGQDNVFILQLGEKYTFCNLAERRLLPRVYDYMEEHPDAAYLLVKYEGKMGIVNFKDEEIIPIEYEEIKLYTNSSMLLVKYEGKYGLIDMNRQKVLLPFIYDEIKMPYPNTSFAQVQAAQRYGLINVQNGRLVIPAEYDKISHLSFYSDIFIVEQNKKQGIYTQEGKQLLPAEYNEITVTNIKNERYYYLFQNGKYGLYNQNGEPVIPVQYDRLVRYQGTDFFTARQANKTGIINSAGTQVLPLQYELVEPLEGNLLTFKIQQNQKYGIANLTHTPPQIKLYKNEAEAQQHYQSLTTKVTTPTPPEAVVETTVDTTQPVYNQVDKEAQYVGGQEALTAFVAKNAVYPQEALQNKKQGEVIVRFVVEVNGTVSETSVLSDEAGSGAGEEVARVLKQTKGWTPAKIKTKAVRSYSICLYEFTLPK